MNHPLPEPPHAPPASPSPPTAPLGCRHLRGDGVNPPLAASCQHSPRCQPRWRPPPAWARTRTPAQNLPREGPPFPYPQSAAGDGVKHHLLSHLTGSPISRPIWCWLLGGDGVKPLTVSPSRFPSFQPHSAAHSCVETGSSPSMLPPHVGHPISRLTRMLTMAWGWG